MKDSSNFKGKETRFELSVSRPKNTIYLSIIGMPKKSHFTIFAIQNFLQNTKKHTWIPFILLRNEWCLFDCFHHEFKVSTQLMVRDYCIAKCKKFSACGGVLMAPRVIFSAIQNIYINLDPGNMFAILSFWQCHWKYWNSLIAVEH